MITRGCVIFAILAKCVFSIPVSPSHVDHEDVKVIRCIVEVLADTLSKPHSIPVSQGCLEILMTDDRLVTILRHHNFLQELQDIAAEGSNERAEKPEEAGLSDESKQSKDLDDTPADQSMLVAMERPKVGAEKRGGEESEERERESGEHNEIPGREEASKGEEILHSMHLDQEGEEEDKQAMPERGETTEEQEKHSRLEEEEVAEGAEPDTPGQHSEAKTSAEVEKQAEQTTEEMRRAVEESGLKHWAHTRQLGHKRAEMRMRSYDQQVAPHHSKEASEQGEEEVWKSPEEHDLHMMARRDPEDRREEEGSASKKTEDGEIEGLAAIESELESVAQKLHELRRG